MTASQGGVETRSCVSLAWSFTDLKDEAFGFQVLSVSPIGRQGVYVLQHVNSLEHLAADSGGLF